MEIVINWFIQTGSCCADSTLQMEDRGKIHDKRSRTRFLWGKGFAIWKRGWCTDFATEKVAHGGSAAKRDGIQAARE